MDVHARRPSEAGEHFKNYHESQFLGHVYFYDGPVGDGWKRSPGWVCVIDSDEFVAHEHLLQYLEQCEARGVSVIVPSAYDMAFSPTEQGVMWERGRWSAARTRPCLFDTRAIEAIDFDASGRLTKFSGRVHVETFSPVRLLRWDRQVSGDDLVYVLGADPREGHNTDNVAERYDDVPYVNQARATSRPDAVGTVARLFGLSPALPERSRVLEVGCGTGRNLLPLAGMFPDSRFMGFDLSARQIEEAQRAQHAAGLSNIRFDTATIEDFLIEEPFDYVICHGVYSWVSHATAQAMLALVQRALAPRGVAYISYNVHPGWHFHQVIRDAMLFRARQFKSADDQIREARNFVARILEAGAGGERLEALVSHHVGPYDWYLYHEYLETHNNPCLFETFAARLQDHGLQYVGDVAFHTMFGYAGLPRASTEWVEAVAPPHRLQREQFLDFLRNRSFRESVVCRADVELQPQWHKESGDALWLTATMHAPTACDTVSGSGRWAEDPVAHRLLTELAQRAPAWVPLDELAGTSWHTVVDGLARGQLAVSAFPPRWSLDVPARPATSPFIRWQAGTDEAVTNLDHRAVPLDQPMRWVLALLDGTRDMAALAAALAAADFAVSALDLNEYLQRLARLGFLLPP